MKTLVQSMLLCTLLGAHSPGMALATGEADIRTYADTPRVTDLGVAIEPRMTMRPKGAPWEYEIRVGLPRSYRNGDRSYPVLWVVDGSLHFEGALNVVAGSNGSHAGLSEMIVVAIGVPQASKGEFGLRRNYDFTSTTTDFCAFTGRGEELARRECKALYDRAQSSETSKGAKLGGSPAFLKFIVDEVRPEIARRYRISGEHILWGYSAGGRFCTYALFSRTAAFNQYICGSPALNGDHGAVFDIEESYAQTHSDLKARVFLSAGEDEMLAGGILSALGIVSGMVRMAEILKARQYPSLELHARILPDYVHTPQGAAASLYTGLMALRADHNSVR